tara:strand:+ start:183 stop:398 length:216 start_codon:yes stop_codon:yes gene_type:complete
MDDDAPIPPPMSDLHQKREINRLESKITDLLVVIDTAQAALRRAESAVPEDLKSHVFNQSARWVMNYELKS